MTDDIATLQYLHRGEYITVTGRPIGTQRMTSSSFSNRPEWFLMLEDDASRAVRRVPLAAIEWFQEGTEAAPDPTAEDPEDTRRSALLRAYRDELGLTNTQLAEKLHKLDPKAKASAHTVACWMAHRAARKARTCPQWPLDILKKAHPKKLSRVKPALTPTEVPSAGRPMSGSRGHAIQSDTETDTVSG